MAYDLEEQESIDQMKAWWDRWGTPITVVVCLACLGFAGWNGWRWYERNQAAKAGSLYYQLTQQVVSDDAKNVATLSSALMDSYGSTIYAPMGALLAADVASKNGDFAQAQKYLDWVLANSKHTEYDTLARVRLAGVYLDLNQPDQALTVLQAAKPNEEQKGLVLDRQGDIYLAKGDVAKARECWQGVLDHITRATQSIEKVVKLKLDSLGQAASS